MQSQWGSEDLTAVEIADPRNELPASATAPLLSVIVPVYNGAGKLERSLQNIQAKVLQLFDAMWKAELERTKIERSILSTGNIPNDDDSVTDENRKSNGALIVEKINEIISDGVSQQAPSLQPTKFVQDWYEIIVVNDGSKDKTRSVIEKIRSKNHRIKCISYMPNMGKGYAIKQGVSRSNGKYILFLDGDGDISADILSNYLTRLSKAHLVIGSKNHARSVVTAPASRRILSKCFQLYAKSLLGLKVGDTQVGLKAGRGEVFRKIFEQVRVNRYAFDVEMLAIASLMDLKIKELPVTINLDKSFRKKEILRMAIDVLVVAFRLRVLKLYQKNLSRFAPSRTNQMACTKGSIAIAN